MVNPIVSMANIIQVRFCVCQWQCYCIMCTSCAIVFKRFLSVQAFVCCTRDLNVSCDPYTIEVQW